MFPQIFGKYVLERELASGGMAVVYLATLRGAGGFEKRLVVKQIRAELASDAAFVERFVAEAKTTVGLSHPNIVPVYELGVEQGVYFIAMELAQGVTLSELLKTGGRLSPEEGAYLGVEISRALDYAHRKAGIVHRDVTPRNVLIDEEGAVRLIDFGIAAPVSGEGYATNDGRSARERIYGSPGHMPLEQLRGGRLTPATDVFAVGALLLEAWTAEPPFRRATKAESDAALSSPPPAPSLTDARLAPLDELLARAVATDPAVRPQSTEELARPLREFLRSADLGDLARRFGERVRRARRASQESVRPPPAATGADRSVTPSTARLSFPSSSGTPATPAPRPLTQPVTETFAAREEVVEWTRPLSDPPPPLSAGVDPGDAEPPPPLAPIPPPPRRRTRAIALVASSVVAAAVGAAVASRSSFERGERAGDVGSSLPSSAVAARAVPGVPGVPGAGEPSPVASSLPPSSTAVIGATPTAVPPQAPPTGSPGGAASAASAPSASSSSSADDTKADVATLSFTSDLPARVSIDGALQGSTPLRGVHKPAGRHVITVVSFELDERLTATLQLARGQATTVHAEFTRAVPTLRVR